MPYDLAQVLLTVLFDLVILFGVTFFLVACGLEASRRQYQQQQLLRRVRSLPPASTPNLSLPAATEPVTMPVRSSRYEYMSA
ncbi:MAG: hypothetical protein ACO31I_08705 [Prochlorotrichaceae cyanobacterium]|jgi:hypothetical protein